jgi:ABC-type multidrug transport system fused ATPase/permease subunit
MKIPLKRYWTLLVIYLRPERGSVALLAILLLGSIGLQLVSPQIIGAFIDGALAGAALAGLVRLALLFIGAALAQQALAVAATYLSESVGWRATNLLRLDLAAHCLDLDLSFHKARTPGELIERVDGDVSELSTFFARLVIDMLGNLLLLIGVLALLFRTDWRIGLSMTIFAAAALTILTRIRQIAVPHWEAMREMSAQFFGFLGEQLAGTEDIRSSGATGYVMQRFYGYLRTWLPLSRRASLAGYSLWMTTLAVFAVGNAVAFGLGAYLWQAGAITIGTVYVIFHYTELLARPIEQIRTQLQNLQRADASIGRVEQLLQTRSRLSAGQGATLPAGPLAVAFDHVTFGYEAHAPILHDLSFRLEPGAVLGLLGHTGSGKTTLARLLFRLYDPTAGQIRLGDTPLSSADLHTLRRHIGLVTQDVQLFQASVRDNLTFFNRSIPDAQILAALDELGLGGWLSALPHGLDTELSAGGGLSAGEAQLLAFARVLLADPGLVILDEASSRLDAATEQLIERAVSKLLRDRTGIIIAHRLGSVQRADQIMILEHGRVREYGRRTALASAPDSHFAALLQTGLEEVLA